MKTAIKTYHRPDGVVGCGFYGEFGGLWQHSIAWPDQSATRMRYEDLEERKIAIKDLAVVPIGDRDSLVVKNAEVGPPVVADQSPPVDDIPGSLDPESGEVEKAEVTPADLPAPEDASPFDASISEAANIRAALALFPDATNKEIIEMLNREKIEIASSQVTRERKNLEKAAEEAAAIESKPGE